MIFKGIYVNGYHIKTHKENGDERLLITQQRTPGKEIIETFYSIFWTVLHLHRAKTTFHISTIIFLKS